MSKSRSTTGKFVQTLKDRVMGQTGPQTTNWMTNPVSVQGGCMLDREFNHTRAADLRDQAVHDHRIPDDCPGLAPLCPEQP